MFCPNRRNLIALLSREAVYFEARSKCQTEVLVIASTKSVESEYHEACFAIGLAAGLTQTEQVNMAKRRSALP